MLPRARARNAHSGPHTHVRPGGPGCQRCQGTRPLETATAGRHDNHHHPAGSSTHKPRGNRKCCNHRGEMRRSRLSACIRGGKQKGSPRAARVESQPSVRVETLVSHFPSYVAGLPHFDPGRPGLWPSPVSGGSGHTALARPCDELRPEVASQLCLPSPACQELSAHTEAQSPSSLAGGPDGVRGPRIIIGNATGLRVWGAWALVSRGS